MHLLLLALPQDRPDGCLDRSKEVTVSRRVCARERMGRLTFEEGKDESEFAFERSKLVEEVRLYCREALDDGRHLRA